MVLLNNGYKFIRHYLCRLIHKTPPGPLFLYLELTKRCNLKCQFCDMWRIKYHDPKNLSRELSLSEIISLIDEAKGMGTILINLGGGEPLLRPDIVEIVKEIKKRDFALSLTTNATLLSKKMIENLIKVGLKHIVISLDSSFPEIHDEMRGVNGTFKKVIQSIKDIRTISNKTKISVNTLITKKNFTHLNDIVKLSNALKVDVINFVPIHNTYPQNLYSSQDETLFFNTPDEIDDLEEELNKTIDFLSRAEIEMISYEYLREIPNFYKNKVTKFRCLAGYIFCEVDSSGDVYPCYSLGKSVGNIRENKLSEIWNSKKFNRRRKTIIHCHNCWLNCYVEPSLRFSLKYLIKNIPKTIKEYKRFLC